MGIGIIVIGSELLSGKRRDGHLEFVINTLAPRAMELDTHYPQLQSAGAYSELLLTLPGVSEGQLMDIMHRFIVEHPDVRLSCLPHMDGDYRETELGVRALAQAAQLAHLWLREELNEAGFAFKEGGR